MQTIATPSIEPAAPAFRIHRYPTALVDRVRLADGRSVIVRPVLPQDAELQRAFIGAMSPSTRCRRFHGPVSELPEATLREMNEIDYSSHLALLAAAIDARGHEIQVAEARWVRRVSGEDSHIADFALAVADGWQGAGLGALLLDVLVRSAAQAGVRFLSGDVLADNAPMRGLLRNRGWLLRPDPEEPTAVVARLDLVRRQRAANDTHAAAAA